MVPAETVVIYKCKCCGKTKEESPSAPVPTCCGQKMEQGAGCRQEE